MQTPNGWFGEMRSFTGGRYFCSESQSCAQSSAGCTSVEYVEMAETVAEIHATPFLRLPDAADRTTASVTAAP